MRISDWSSDVCSSDLMDEVTDGPGIRIAFLEQADFVGDAAVAEPPHAKPCLDDLRKGQLLAEVALGLDHAADEAGLLTLATTVFDQMGVHNRIEILVIHHVFYLAVDFIATTAY